MNELAHIVEILPANIRTYIKSQLPSKSKGERGKSKYIQLFELLCKHSNNNDEFYSNKIYKVAKSQEYRVLKYRLKNKILKLLIQEDITQKLGDIDRVEFELMESIRQLYAIRILLKMQGNSEIILRLLNEVEIKTKKNEHYFLLLDCLNIKKYNLAFISSPDEFKTINSEIEKYHTVLKLVNKSNDYYYQHIVLQQGSKPNISIQEKTEVLRNCIHELRKDLEFTKSPLSLYFILLLEIEYHETNGDLIAGRDTCQTLCDHVLTHPSVTRKQRMATAYINAAYFNGMLFDFNTAILQANKSLEYASKHSINYSLNCILLIKLYIYRNDIKSALQILNKTKLIVKKVKSKALLSQLNFIELILYLKTGKLHAASKIALTNTELDQDKFGYGLFQRLLAVYVLAILGKIETADSLIETLMRKRSEYSTKNKNPRLYFLIELYFYWSKTGYNMVELNKGKSATLLERLNNINSDIAWKPLSEEVVSLSQILQRDKIEIPNLLTT